VREDGGGGGRRVPKDLVLSGIIEIYITGEGTVLTVSAVVHQWASTSASNLVLCRMQWPESAL
jgi:hypothetical protein